MDYQQLPAPPNMANSNAPTPTQQHLQQLMHGNLIGNNLQIITSMQPPPPPPSAVVVSNQNANTNGTNQTNQNNNNIPLQVVHSLSHITSNNPNPNNSNPSNNNNNSSLQNANLLNTQTLPPPAQLIQLQHQQQHLHHHQQQQQQQLHHHTSNNSNNNNPAVINNNHPNGGGAGDEGNRWTQFQMQQLWRHHAYLNGNLFIILIQFDCTTGNLGPNKSTRDDDHVNGWPLTFAAIHSVSALSFFECVKSITEFRWSSSSSVAVRSQIALAFAENAKPTTKLSRAHVRAYSKSPSTFVYFTFSFFPLSLWPCDSLQYPSLFLSLSFSRSELWPELRIFGNANANHTKIWSRRLCAVRACVSSV